MTEQIRLALIDDDAGVLDALCHYLARHQIRTSCFMTATEFLVALNRQEEFDCIVSDVRMPGMSGLDLMRHLNVRAFAQPVILITGHGDVVHGG
jgi:two-component system response regulator FixJ